MNKWMAVPLALLVAFAPTKAFAQTSVKTDASKEEQKVTTVQSNSSESKEDTNGSNSLILDSDALSFSKFEASSSLQKISGAISLQGIEQDQEHKMHPVYTFKLKNSSAMKAEDLNAAIALPEGTYVNFSCPPDITVIDTDHSRKKEDVKVTYDEIKGIQLHIPDMDAGESLTFSVKFLFMPIEWKKPEITSTITSEKSENGKWKLMFDMHALNANAAALKHVMLKVKLPDADSLCNVKIDGESGMKADMKNNHEIWINADTLKPGTTHFMLEVTASSKQWTTSIPVLFYLMLNDNDETALTPVSVMLKPQPMMFDWHKLLFSGDFKAVKETKDMDNLMLHYMMKWNNQNQMESKPFQVKVILPSGFRLVKPEITGMSGITWKMDSKGILWLMIPGLKQGESTFNLNLMGKMTTQGNIVQSNISVVSGQTAMAPVSLSTKMMGSTGSSSGTPSSGGTVPSQGGTPSSGGTVPSQGGTPSSGGTVPSQGGTPSSGGTVPSQSGTSVQTAVTGTTQAMPTTLPITGGPSDSLIWEASGLLLFAGGFLLYRRFIKA